MKKNPLLTKIIGLQDRHAKILEMLIGERDGGRVLDLGAREGLISKKMKDAGFQVTAADAVMAVPEQYGIPRVIADFNFRLPFRDESFDVITTFNTIEELESPFVFIRECFRILAPGGLFILGTPNIINLQSRVAICLTGFYRFNGRPANEVNSGKWAGQRMNFQDYFRLRYAVHRNGFRISQATTNAFSNKAMAFCPLYPVLAFFTQLALRREKDPLQKQRNKEIYRHVMSLDLIFGKHLLLLAEKPQRQ